MFTRLSRKPVVTDLPRHLGVIMDGNRRWARAAGYRNASLGHRVGAEHLSDLLDWCWARGIEHLSVYVLSADNIRRRERAEVDYLFDLIETVLPGRVRDSRHWALHIAGDLDLLPPAARHALVAAVEDTAGRRGQLTLAVGYDPHADIVNGVRSLLRDGEPPDDLEAAITARLSGGPVKEIDLVIRTSGEHRISGFFPWQTQQAEVYVSPLMWPAFGEGDLDAALRHFAERHARRLSPLA